MRKSRKCQTQNKFKVTTPRMKNEMIIQTTQKSKILKKAKYSEARYSKKQNNANLLRAACFKSKLVRQPEFYENQIKNK
jgi:hypothetical protein